MSEVLREYGVAATILFPLVTKDAVDFKVGGITFVAADTQISKDEGAFANTTNTPVHEGNGIYSLALTATEMTAARIVITCVDAATKLWEDQAIIIATFASNAGDASQFGIQLGADAPEAGIASVDGSTTAATALKNFMILSGTINDVAPTVSDFDGVGTLSTEDDFYKGMLLLFTTGPLAGIGRIVLSYDGTSKNFTFTRDWPPTPANGNAFTFVALDTPTLGMVN